MSDTGNKNSNTNNIKNEVIEPIPRKPTNHTTLGMSHPIFAVVQKNGLTLGYHGRANHTHDVGVARTIKHIPLAYSYYYFEMQVLSHGMNADISIGFIEKETPLNQNIGMTKGTCYAKYHIVKAI